MRFLFKNFILKNRIDEKAKKYTGALCGLGFDPHLRRPLYTENDIEDVFEVEFSERDISLVKFA